MRGVVLPSGLADRGADDDLEDLVFAQARSSSRGDVLIGDLVGPILHLADQRRQWLAERRVVERGTALSARGLAVSFEDPGDDRSICLADVRHLVTLGCDDLSERLQKADPLDLGMKPTSISVFRSGSYCQSGVVSHESTEREFSSESHGQAGATTFPTFQHQR
jgi:hypothetical protein